MNKIDIHEKISSMNKSAQEHENAAQLFRTREKILKYLVYITDGHENATMLSKRLTLSAMDGYRKAVEDILPDAFNSEMDSIWDDVIEVIYDK